MYGRCYFVSFFDDEIWIRDDPADLPP